MSYLLDTHVLLWARLEPNKLTAAHQAILRDPAVPKYISTLSLWEISLKFSLKKLTLGTHTPEEFLESALQLGLQLVEPTADQFVSFHRLPAVVRHKDPFDRMLIWQAMQSKLTLVSTDKQLAAYKLHGLSLA